MRAPFLLVVLSACGGAGFEGTLADGGVVLISAPDSGAPATPATRAGLLSIAQSGAYLSWKAEPAPHQTSGPHGGQVRTFVNDVLYASLKAGNTMHPRGAIAVKELFSNGTRTGWAIDAKDDDGVWTYFEGFEPQLNQYFFRGSGNLCSNCHAGGVDSVLTPASSLP
ncbi:MAG: hypothetical protein ABTQ32_03365 [Myxococcaceae bacterium]